MRPVRIGIVFLVILMIGVAVVPYRRGLAQQNEGDVFTYAPIIMVPAPPVPPADEAASRITVPAGFEIRIFADGIVGKPRFMNFGPDGHLYISLMSAGQIARLPDDNYDGLADTREIVADSLSLPHGIEWHNDGQYDWLYVAEGDKVERLRDSTGDGMLDERELVTGDIPGPQGHSSRTVHFGPDGKMYVTAGSSCNICEESDTRRAAIMRFNADGSIPSDNPFVADSDPNMHPVWALGLRNSVDFTWTDDGRLWADHNGVDGLGDDVPPEEIVIEVEEGQHYGWPYCYTPVLGANVPPQTAEVRDTRISTPSGFTCADDVVPALFTDPAHSAPLGMTFGTANNFPEDYADDLFVAYHGSWNTDTPENYRDCKIQRVHVNQDGEPESSEAFANGWREDGQKCGAAWGRPADVIFGPGGVMYISDDKAGRVYRVVYVGS